MPLFQVKLAGGFLGMVDMMSNSRQTDTTIELI